MLQANGIVLRDHKLIYWYIPKCACTSLKAFFGRAYGFEFDDPHAIPFEFITPDQAGDYPHFISFAVVRNPLDRLVSLYRDKIRFGYRGWGFPDGVERFVFADRQEFHENMSFPEFARACFQSPVPDPHFAPQADQLTDRAGRLVARRTFKLERFDDVKQFLTQAGFNTGDIRHSNKSNRVMWYADRYDRDLLREAQEYFRKDFQLFNYIAYESRSPLP